VQSPDQDRIVLTSLANRSETWRLSDSRAIDVARVCSPSSALSRRWIQDGGSTECMHIGHVLYQDDQHRDLGVSCYVACRIFSSASEDSLFAKVLKSATVSIGEDFKPLSGVLACWWLISVVCAFRCRSFHMPCHSCDPTMRTSQITTWKVEGLCRQLLHPIPPYGLADVRNNHLTSAIIKVADYPWHGSSLLIPRPERAQAQFGSS